MGKIILFTIQSELDSAKKLGFETRLYPHGTPVENFNDDLCIRWGMGSQINSKNWEKSEFKRVLNPADSITQNCNKAEALTILSKAVNTPKLYLSRVPKGKLVVRRPMHHSAGNGFSVQRGFIQLHKGEEYATQYIKTDKEFRVYYCANGGGKFMLCRRVTYNKKRQAEKHPCRSKWSYRFLKVVPNTIKTKVKKAFKVMGLDFGAADILFKDGKYYFCELNTAVTIDMDIIQKFFRDNLLKLIKEKYPKFKERKGKAKAFIHFNNRLPAKPAYPVYQFNVTNQLLTNA